MTEFTKFLIAGGVNTAIGYSVFLATLHIMGLSTYIVNAISYFVGIIFSYALNRNYVFKSNAQIAPRDGKMVFRFVVGFFISFLLNLAALHISHIILLFNIYLSQFIGMSIYTASFFLINKTYVWRSK